LDTDPEPKLSKVGNGTSTGTGTAIIYYGPTTLSKVKQQNSNIKQGFLHTSLPYKLVGGRCLLVLGQLLLQDVPFNGQLRISEEEEK
jgi:hypothetical protein